MKKILLYFLFLQFSISAQHVILKHKLRMLALGDSYTIGQSVTVSERWPSLLSDSLKDAGVVTDTLGIIATTGWRTDDLLNAIKGKGLEKQNYNLVSLLIGVNNQFQAKPFSQYVTEFPALLDSALRYAGGDKSHVFVVSIPDYAYTPFGQQSSNPAQISSEIDLYNHYNKQVADSMGITYFDITPISREGLIRPAYVANDGLHPSGIQYGQWVRLMLKKMSPEVQTGISSFDKKNQDLTIYPNPARDLLVIDLPGGMHDHENLLKMYDSKGSLVLKQTFFGNFQEVSLAKLPPGFYMVKINADGKSVSKRVIKE